MKKSFFLILFSFAISIGYAQTKGINYKAKLADNSGNTLANQNTTVKFSIYEGNMAANLVYQETHTTTTDANGIIMLNIGEGSSVTGDFTTINWGFDTHFLKTEVDTGSGYVEIGNTEFKTVPYALHANTVEDPGVSSPFAEASPNVISANNTVADFVVGSPNTEDQNNVNFDGRLFWDDSKAAFRAGSVDGTQWNDVNRGLYSFAAGQNNTASGVNAVAFGENNTVQGSGSVAFGRDNTISTSGAYGATIGFGNSVTGAQAIAIGRSTEAKGNYSFAGGNASDVFGEGSFAYGFQNVARGDYNTVFGSLSNSNAKAESSFTAGYGLENQTVNGTVLGEWNELDTNALLNIGNGNSTSRKTAFTVRRNGDVLINNLSGFGTRPVYVNGTGLFTTQSGSKYLSIPSSAFIVSDSDSGFQNGILLRGYSGEPTSFYAPIQLPHNAVIQKITLSYLDETTSDLNVRLLSTALSGSPGVFITKAQFNPNVNSSNFTTYIHNLNVSIDNQSNFYHLEISVAGGNNWGSNLFVRGVVIEYTE